MEDDDLPGGTPDNNDDSQGGVLPLMPSGDAATPAADAGAGDAAGEAAGAAAGGSEPSALDSLLDSLTEPGPGPAGEAAAGRVRGPDGRFLPGTPHPANQQNSEPGSAGNAAPPAPGQQPATGRPAAPDNRTPEEREQAELLEGVKSERGRERIRQVFAERQEAQQSLGAIREMVSAAGLTPETFGQHIQFAQLLNSNDPQQLQQAAQMLEGVREQLYRRMGVEAPGVDVLAEFPDLAGAVNAGQMPKAMALETAKLRRQAAEQDQREQVQRQIEQEDREFRSAVARAEQQMQTYMASRAKEADAPLRAKVVKDFFANPANLQRFASTYQPHQWFDAIRLMYDNAQVAAPPAARTPAPLSGRAGALGRPATNPNLSPEDRTLQAMDRLGL